VYLKSVIPSVKIDLKYFGKDNFTGNKINGYRSNRCIISNEAASALKHVQMDLSHFRYGLKVFEVICWKFLRSFLKNHGILLFRPIPLFILQYATITFIS
jgi:hypothetical protein